ncbi:regulator of G-protein signaling 17 isoform X1 [Melanaphis sacchari]|uniref:regulator of G-protein signaling 17 isoform X1 n=1 Tax=Melanaphis sacchari TaxID=742174 RepID=UPI000DC13B89|nr:regulator of G-protein signaling 17 isoform X1 [Melanaphis sacchari]XP_025190447.1 regulator of G-protein signaling 17 isoform X1 [Melanaphis sacchari]XP_025190448.1 regulator of G-protein signaling 17 isoform X1 [Melanaphis sacchari]XP_025190449.1 regulator of G-protein signaling 17 isoform X1 [Melanaphis sacchari]
MSVLVPIERGDPVGSQGGSPPCTARHRFTPPGNPSTPTDPLPVPPDVAEPNTAIETQVTATHKHPCISCWCCCCGCSCVYLHAYRSRICKLWDRFCFPLKGHPPKTNGNGSSGGIIENPVELRPPLDEIRSWSKSFDRLLKCPAGKKIFRDFLRCEYSEENILFWMAVEELKKESNPDIIEEKARFIYEDYISILSPKEVSLDSRVRDIVNKNINQPSSHMFDEAQLQIYTLMHRDSYPRFINSSQYKKLAKLENGATGNAPNSGQQTPTKRKQSNI